MNTKTILLVIAVEILIILLYLFLKEVEEGNDIPKGRVEYRD